MLLLRIVVLLSVLALAGCGFQLRGAQMSEVDMTYRLVDGDDLASTYAQFKRVLKNTLIRAGYREANAADLMLQIHTFRRENIDGAVDQELRVAEQISSSALSFSVYDDQGRALADELRLQVRQVFRVDRSTLLGSFEQRSSTEQILDQKLADQVVRSLSIIKRRDLGAKPDARSGDAQPKSLTEEVEIVTERDAT
tara:strand:- start:3783 stop:4370 length:588 start_codon:yes stop_codon:yes gene_type:complete